MTWYEAYSTRLHEFSVPAWDDIPDLGLYMDQVITYLERTLSPLLGEGRRVITPSMINNYVKSGLILRPQHKKYDRPQIAQLLMVTVLKRAMSMEDMRALLMAADETALIALYEAFCVQQREAVANFQRLLPTLAPMQCAVTAVAYTLICEEILHAQNES